MEPSEVLFERALQDIDETLRVSSRAHFWSSLLPLGALERHVMGEAHRPVKERRQALEQAWQEVLSDQGIDDEERERRKRRLASEALSVAQGAHESIPGAPATPQWLARTNAVLFDRQAEEPEPPVSIPQEVGEQAEDSFDRALGAVRQRLPSFRTAALVVGGIAAVGVTVYVVTRRCR